FRIELLNGIRDVLQSGNPGAMGGHARAPQEAVQRLHGISARALHDQRDRRGIVQKHLPGLGKILGSGAPAGWEADRTERLWTVTALPFGATGAAARGTPMRRSAGWRVWGDAAIIRAPFGQPRPRTRHKSGNQLWRAIRPTSSSRDCASSSTAI